MLRLRLLSLFLDVLLCAGAADLIGLAATGGIWRYVPAARGLIPAVWAAAAAAATVAFLLRDASGGLSRRWFALEIRRADGALPGPAGSLRRNLPLLIPGWNLYDAWPALKDGGSSRRSDQAAGTRILRGV